MTDTHAPTAAHDDATAAPTGASSPVDTSAAAAAVLDAADPLKQYPTKFVRSTEVRAYLDGNSLGRPTTASAARLAEFVDEQWGGRLIRGWDEAWYELPLTLGDRLGAATLGAAPGQTFIGDSTTVVLYKLIRAGLSARPERSEIVIDTGNFPTDRYLVEGIAAELGKTLRWIDPASDEGVTADEVKAVLNENTALVVISHVAYRSGHLADMPGITTLVHEAGALVLWDLCHSAGVVETELDAWGVDLAAGCTYKYLNGGPGSPAFGYVRAEHIEAMTQPIQGWMGSNNPFEMGPGYAPHEGIRRFISGTPSVVGSLAMQDMLGLIEEAGIPAIRAKSIALTEYALALIDELLVPLGVTVSSPRDAAERGSHVTIDHESFAAVNAELWKQGIIPDFRRPHGIRLGLSPLSTTFAEVQLGIEAIHAQLTT
ncbi:kynureninase [Salinibacterium sp. SWN248]|uniref:kynureninase n=1 Tax=Salinibacterium sp. SWN248 TaxID=2792056 RepID=UPI0018CCA5A7|nr:aminotransferase class V-fold PLP-dependent enzyme [Salinibacterium sp. SWN248]MBH0023079.1 aminotransferase class V-fold PLP-dependent enzyme [Salinibacterium sp. SWN248]